MMQQHIFDAIVLAGMSFIVLLFRLFKGLSIEAGTLLLIGTVLAISSHIFPWYTPALLSWLVVLVGPLWTPRGPSGKGLAVGIVWYFTCISLAGYFLDNTRDWHVYYEFVYDEVLAGGGAALIL